MTGRTISAGYTGGIVLGAGDFPLTVTKAGTVTSAGSAALSVSDGTNLALDNAGRIEATGTGTDSIGIFLGGPGGAVSGAIVNQAGGTIAGGSFGIQGTKAAVVANSGAISAVGAVLGEGVRLGGGTVDNTGGSILGAHHGVNLTGVGTVTNTGSITGTASTGVLLGLGGTVTNSGAQATITGREHGVRLAGAGSVSNTGSISATGTAAYTVQLDGGGSFDNGVGGVVTGAVAAALIGPTATLGNSGLLSGSIHGVGVALSPAQVTNHAGGQIEGARTGVLVTHGGSVGNAGAITGRFGVQMTNFVGTVGNSGSIGSTGKFANQAPELVGAGVQVQSGGTIINEAGGRISGYWIGAQVGSFNGGNPNGGRVENAGTIVANDGGSIGAAVWFKGNGTISNAATGNIGGGPFGIVTYNTVTIVNRGAISGTAFAVTTSTAGTNNRIIVYPGASFSGTVAGDSISAAVPTGVLELAAGAGSGAITGFGSKYLGFGRVEVGAGATWSLSGTVGNGQTVALAGAGAALTLANPAFMGGVITGFDATTALVLGGVDDVTGATLEAGNVLTLARSAGPAIMLRLDPSQSFPPGSFGFAGGSGGTVLSAPCFALGTRIAVPGGEVAVEALAPGMRVLLARGGVGEVVWVGHRRVACAAHPRPQEVWPVRVVAGAFARGVPGRDLLLSPDHAVFLGGVLIPVRHLVNGRTVRQEAADAVTYFHVELAAHDVLLAEGLACESYLDTGNRASFANGGGAVALHPDFARRQWQAQGCATLVEDGPAVASARMRLLARAGAMGLRRGRDSGLAVRADGVALALAAAGARREVALPAGTRAVAIESRIWVPAQMGEGDDWRRLGVAVGRVLLDGVAAQAPCFGGGWHAAEGAWRWSDGCGWLHTRGARRLSFEMATEGVYWAA